MSIAIIIPARYASQRYPGKPLVDLKGATGRTMSLIERSWRAALAVGGADFVAIATDDDRIAKTASDFGANLIMTSSDCRNGTERCAEAIEKLDETYEIVVNLQGDAPLTPPWFIEDLIAALQARPESLMATPVLRCDGRTLGEFLSDRKNGRVGGTTAVFDRENRALYFSKEVIPFTSETFDPSAPTPVFHHVGVYGYRPVALQRYKNLPIGPLETLEGLEQLRFLENGMSVECVEVDSRGHNFWELNNPADVSRLERMMADMGVE